LRSIAHAASDLTSAPTCGPCWAMNYRHAYHAGNFADVLKHAVLALVIAYLKRKEAPFRVIDTHAGTGRYRLTSEEAVKTGEWKSGIGRLLGPDAQPLPAGVARQLRPYLDAIRAANPDGGLDFYPGSPLIALSLMRPQDTLVANELHPEDLSRLRSCIGGDRRAKVTGLDAWVALKSLLPPRERRGVVLVDPPFEEAGELERACTGLAQALKRFSTGIYLLWYPIKDVKPIGRFHARFATLGAPKMLRVELMIERATNPDRLNGCGLVIVNPPYTLEGEIAAVLPELERRMAARGAGSGSRLDWIEPSPAQAPEERHR
jgi:23S rRNA (adenine2030-N6)-methyltransferase